LDLGLVGEHDVGEPRRHDAERPPLGQPAPGLFGNRRGPLRQTLAALMEVDDEVRGRQHPEPQRRIEQRRRARAGRGSDNQRDGEAAHHERTRDHLSSRFFTIAARARHGGRRPASARHLSER
jgi:hypothetical protein